MDVSFTREQLFDVFAIANADTHMIPTMVGYAGALGWMALRWQRPSAHRVLFLGLGLLWGWIGAGFFLGPFAVIAPSAGLFGGSFLVQAGLFLLMARESDRTSGFPPTWQRWCGATLEFYALVAYPLLGLFSGHDFAEIPWFGATPCPSTIWTLGVLVGAGRLDRKGGVIPLLWCGVGMVAATKFDVMPDWGLGVSGVCVVVCALARPRASR